MSVNVVNVNDNLVHLVHQRVPSFVMEVWCSPPNPKWFWNIIGQKVLGSDTNGFVALELAMTYLTLQVEGPPA